MAGKNAKSAKKKKAKKPSRRQQDLLEQGGPGVGLVSIPEVDEAASDYVRKRDRRQDFTRLEVEAKQRLIDVLHTHEDAIGRDGEHVLRYKHEDLMVELMPEGGTITLQDHSAMVEELVTRRERLHDALDKVEGRFDTMRDEFVQSIEGDE